MTTRCTSTARITAQVAGEEVVMHGGSRRGSHSQARAGQPRRGSPAKPGQAKPGQAKPAQGKGEAKAGHAKAGSRGTEPRTAQYAPVPDADRLARLLEPVVHALDM